MSKKSEEAIQQTIHSFWETIPPIWNTVRARVRTTATQKFDITVEQFHILRHIRKEAHSVSELAEAGRISRPAISQGVDALVEKKLIHRTQGTGDRRYVRLDLTPEGNALLDAIFKQARLWMEIQLSTLNADELKAVNTGLALLREALCGK